MTDDSSAEEWRAWIPDLVSEIEGEKTFDVSDLMSLTTAIIMHTNSELLLRRITKLALKRAKHLGMIPSGESSEPAAVEGVQGHGDTEPVDPLGAVALVDNFNQPIVGENGIPFVPRTHSESKVIRVSNGCNYNKMLIEGRNFRLKRPDGAFREWWFLDGVVVKAVTVGTKNIRVRFAMDPTKTHPKAYRLRTLWQEQVKDPGAQIVVPVEFFLHVFEG